MDDNGRFELIKIHKQDENSVVNARELHQFLEVKTLFKDWIVRMIEYGFEKDVDYTITYFDYNGNVLSNSPLKNEQSHTQGVTYHRKEYALTLSMAKELSMIQRSEKGKQARLYFIRCEKELKEQRKIQLPDFTNPIEAARAWADEAEGRQIAEQKNAETTKLLKKAEEKLLLAEPIINVLKSINGVIDIQTFARETHKIFGMGSINMFRFLREHHIIRYHWTGGKTENFPYQKFIDNGWFEMDNRESTTNGQTHISHIIMVTAKGRVKLCQFIQKMINKKETQRNTKL